jgi:hypothetical protein
MVDPQREVPSGLEDVLPTLLRGRRPTLGDPSAWAPFTHQDS